LPKKKNFLLNIGEGEDEGWNMDCNYAKFEDLGITTDAKL